MDLDHFLQITCQKIGASRLEKTEKIQSLWSGYGEISRYKAKGSRIPSIILKHVQLIGGSETHHPRGWNSDISHQRKVTSYEVESAWYQSWSSHCDHHCRVPQCYAIDKSTREVWIALEDLDAAGYSARKSRVTWNDLTNCLQWLAHFHATFMGQQPTQLWPQGTYWHLDTRPEELKALNDIPLKNAAHAIDQKLEASPFKTFVHGDAKLANFCFSPNGQSVSAVDFQYVGGGCGMKDVAYFVGSCLDESESEARETKILDTYFNELSTALEQRQVQLDFSALEQDWRTLYPYAWTDFHRFLKGWSPGHWKINAYSERLARKIIS